MVRVVDIVFLHNNVLDKQLSRKLYNCWLGSYLIREATLDWKRRLKKRLKKKNMTDTYVSVAWRLSWRHRQRSRYGFD